jgi:cullin 1
VILLAFNSTQSSQSQTVLSYEDLKNLSNLPDEALKRVMHSMTCGSFQLLKKTNLSSTIGTDDVFSCNLTFTSKLKRFRLPLAVMTAVQNTSAKKVEESRGYAIEAAIVRVMKARKRMSHQELIVATISELSDFTPEIKVSDTGHCLSVLLLASLCCLLSFFSSESEGSYRSFNSERISRA